MKKLSLVLVALSMVFVACNSGSENNDNKGKRTLERKIISKDHIKSKYGEGLYAQIHTIQGDILLKLAMDKAPLTVANFVALAEGTMENTARPAGTPFYDDLTFHRVDKGFVIQGGDPQGNGLGGPGYEFRNEIHPALRHDSAGVLSMANGGPNTNGSQFFIMLARNSDLDNRYSVFGTTVEGLDVIQRIAIGDRMMYIEVIRIGDEAENFNALETFNRLKNPPAPIEEEEDANS